MKKFTIQLTNDQVQKAIKLCLDNARSFLDDAELSIKNNKTDHTAIPIEFAIEEVGKAKIIFDKSKLEKPVIITEKDGIYDHKKKLEICIYMFDLEPDEKMLQGMVYGDSPVDHLFDPFVQIMIGNGVKKLQDTGNKGHDERMGSSFVDFDQKTGESILSASTDEFIKLRSRILYIVDNYPNSFSKI